MGGELRELTMRKLHPAALRYGFRGGFASMTKGTKHYCVCRRGVRKYLTVRYLKTLELVDYDIPVREKIQTPA